MAIIVFQHSPTDHLGRLAPVLRDHAHRIDLRRLDQGHRVPGDFDGVDAVISLGGPMNVGDNFAWMKPEMDYLAAAHARQIPLLGICLGHQLLAAALGGEVGPSATPEFGFARVSTGPAGQTDTMLAGVPWSTMPFHAHGQEVKKLPEGAIALQSSAACKVQAFKLGLRTYGFQYHFETTSADVELFIRDAWGQSVMNQLGLTPETVRKQLIDNWDGFARLGDRLCENIVQYMFTPIQKLRA
jgi:GMP synthase-like glutamine amidotransferase